MLTKFIHRLYRYCDGKIEIRILPERRQFFFDKGNIEGVLTVFKKYKNSQIYVGVATRDGQGGGKNNIIEIPAFWVDVDFKSTPRAQAAALYRKFPFKPTITIKSGAGAHMYWCLSEPAGQNEIPAVEDINHRVVAALGGDLGSCDAAHILRPPGTLNHKYNPPRLVELTVINDFEYTLERFIETLPESPQAARMKGKSTNPDGWLVEALKGVKQGTVGRNPTGAKIAGYFINKLPAKDIIAILTAWNERNNPPLKDNEIPKIVKSVSRYKKTKNGAPNGRKRASISFA